MAIEIERKFLLASDDWRAEVEQSIRLIQGYLSRGQQSAVRVRVKGETAQLNIKHTVDGISRLEYEYPLPLKDAQEILERVALRPLIDKTRHHVRRGRHLWEIDEFYGDNAGLIVAEIELSDPAEPFDRPHWLGKEVSEDVRYYNSRLSECPYSQW